MIVGTDPISLASGDPPWAAQHGPHTTARNTVARGRPTRTRHVTHSPPGNPDPANAPAAPTRVGVESDAVGTKGSAAMGSVPGVVLQHADDAAAESCGSGGWVPARVSPAGNTGPRRGSPDMVAPACSGRQKPTRRSRLSRAIADEIGVAGAMWLKKPVERPDFYRGVLLLCAKR